MAKLHCGKSSLGTAKWQYLLVAILAFAGALYMGFYRAMEEFQAAPFDSKFASVFPYMVGFLVLGKAADYFWNRFNAMSSGQSGEDVTNNALSSLKGGYEVFSNVPIADTEIDDIVVGPNGVFVVETKNNKGTILAREHDKEWTIEKVGRNGGEYTATMRNPLKQMKWHVHLLADYLKGNGIKVWVEGAVFFSNASASVCDAPAKVFSSEYELLNYISNYQPRHELSEGDQKRICRLIGELQ